MSLVRPVILETNGSESPQETCVGAFDTIASCSPPCDAAANINVQIAPSFPCGDATLDANTSPVDVAELVHIAPPLPDAATYINMSHIEEVAEPVLDIAPPLPSSNTAVDANVYPVEVASELAYIAYPAQETAEVAHSASSFPSSNAAANIASPVLEAAEFPYFAPCFPCDDDAADADVYPAGAAPELAYGAPPLPSLGAAANIDASPVVPAAELVHIASVPPSDATVNHDAPPIDETATLMYVPPPPPFSDPAVQIDPSPVVKAVELVQIAPPLPSSDAGMNSHVPAVPEANEPVISVVTCQEAAEEEIPRSSPTHASKAESVPGFLSFYGLAEQPFGVTPDPAYLYPSAVHREALESLSRGIENLRGFMVLVAEPGMGKTTLLNKLMEELRNSTRTVFVFQTQCNSREFFRYLLNELGVASAGMDLVAMHKALNEVLFHEMLQGRRFVLIVDEAQNLHESVLETIRLLSDFETTHAKLLQIVLAGQPQLVDKLRRPSLSQLRQRIATLTNLKPLDAAETARYIEHRLQAAGSRDQLIFTPDALALIAERSQGVPRSINNLCANALMLGYAERRVTLDSDIVQKVAEKLSLDSLVECPQLVEGPQPDEAPSKPAPVAAADSSSELLRLMLAALGGQHQPDPAPLREDSTKPEVAITGTLTELVKCRHRGKESEFRIQVSLERESSPDIPIAERYYCGVFYVPEEQAKTFRVGQTIKIKIVPA